jgi:hypothetical protein
MTTPLLDLSPPTPLHHLSFRGLRTSIYTMKASNFRNQLTDPTSLGLGALALDQRIVGKYTLEQ